MTVVPRQSTTTSAPPAPTREAAPRAAMRPSSIRIASASRRGAVRIPVASAPMLTRPVVAIQYSPRQRSTRALAAAQSYERNIRVFTTGCDAE